jgi:transposase
MSYIIGLDAHISYCEFAVYNQDNKKLLECKRLNTSEEILIDYIRKFKSPKVIIFEESTLAHWLYSIFKPYFDEVVVAEPYENALIYRSDQKSDKEDPRKLVKLYLMNSIKRVYHTNNDILGLKRMVLQYHSYVRDQTKIKNQIKAKYRLNGVFIKTDKVYSLNHQAKYIKMIEDRSSRVIITSLLNVLSEVNIQKELVKKLMKTKAKKYRVITEFKRIPGVGDITAITFFALIITPERFKSKEKLWSYCKLGISTKESGGTILAQKLTRRGNPLLKCSILQAVLKSINLSNSCFRQMYLRLIGRGLQPNIARITVGRKMLSTMYYIWLKGLKFDPAYIN